MSTAGPWNYGEEYQRDVMAALMAKPGSDETWYHLTAKEYEKQIEQARSTTRQNILRIVETDGLVHDGVPEQDSAVAMAALLQKDRVHQELAERAHLLQGQVTDMRAQRNKAVGDLCQREMELLGTIKGRDKTIDRLCRHIAFQVAK